MKNKIISLLLLLCLCFSIVSCGEYKPPVTDGGSSSPGDNGNENTGSEGGEDPSDDKNNNIFTVKLIEAGEPYAPPAVSDEASAVQVRLSNGVSVYTEKLDEDGTATFTGLDGEYSVSVINIPDAYTYDPNIYKVSSKSPVCHIDLLKITSTKGSGAGLYSSIMVSYTGVYRANVKRENQVVYYEFKPSKPGKYAIESMMDVSAEMFNPMVDVYNGTTAYKLFINRIDGGGASGTYTKNFKHILEIDDEFIGNSYTFGILVEGKDAVYPTYVDFKIEYLGSYNIDFVTSDIIVPEFTKQFMTSEFGVYNQEKLDEYYDYLEADKILFGSSRYIDAAVRVDGKRVFDQTAYKLNPVDGFYHVYDEVKYESTDGWGPILYAAISTPCIFLADPLTTVEYHGNKTLTVSEGTENYKLFIEGYAELTKPHGDSGPYLCNSDCPCLSTNNGCCAIEDNCTKCKNTCRHLPREAIGILGYSGIVDAGGRAPVTQELKDFLQKLSESQRYFADGNGWAENHDPRYDAYEDSQWLFACGYYY